MKFFKTLHRAERRSFGLALAFYIVAAFGPIVAAPVSNALPDRFLFHVFLGVAVLFQTDALLRRQFRGKEGFEEPNHAVVFVLTIFSGPGYSAQHIFCQSSGWAQS